MVSRNLPNGVLSEEVSSMLNSSIEKGKPTEKWGRKATGLRGFPMIAELPESADRRHAADDPHSVLTGPAARGFPESLPHDLFVKYVRSRTQI